MLAEEQEALDLAREAGSLVPRAWVWATDGRAKLAAQAKRMQQKLVGFIFQGTRIPRPK